VFRVAEMGLQAAQGTKLEFEGFNDVPPDSWTGADIAGWGLQVRERILTWWKLQEAQDATLDFAVPTYYGQRPMHDVLERTTWHSAQHTRQVMLMLESHAPRRTSRSPRRTWPACRYPTKCGTAEVPIGLFSLERFDSPETTR
jgi:hypothetical protein